MAGLPMPRLPRTRLRRIGSLAAATALATAQLAVASGPVLAAAPSLVVTADNPGAVPAGHNWSFNDFFPRTLSVPQGATIGFAIQGFHTATLLPTGTTAAQDRVANGIVQADGDDTSPNLNGSSHMVEVIPNVSPIPGGCGTVATPCTFAGSSVVSSGAPLGGPPAGPFVVNVTAPPGTYAFLCRIHPGMEGALTVLASGASGTTPAALAAAAAAQTAADVAAGTAAEAAASAPGVTNNANGTTTWTLSAGTSDPEGHVAINEMLPANVTIKKGDIVTWRSRAVNEPHTVTFPKDINTDRSVLCESGAVDTPATPTVIPPTSPLDFTCGAGPVEFETGGGNGVATVTSPTTVSDSGWIASLSVVNGFGLPPTAAAATWSVSFTGAVAGTYTYVCQIHQGMQGTLSIAAVKPPTPGVTLPPTTTSSQVQSVDGSAGLGAFAWLVLATISTLVAGSMITRRRTRG